MNRRRIIIALLLLTLITTTRGQIHEDPKGQKVLVCGDKTVQIVDLDKSTTEKPHIIWRWDSHDAADLPEDFRLKKFNTMDDCKITEDQTLMLVSSSSGGIAVIRLEDQRVLFYAEVPNAHSVEMLPDNRIAAAASTNAHGNKLMIFDLKSQELLFEDSLYSAHGLVWDHKRKGLFALGYDVLRFYIDDQDGSMQLEKEWNIPGESGHDLTMTPDGNHLLMTEHTGAWIFDINLQKFDKIESFPDAENIKSLGINKNGQYVYTIPEESWWTFHVSFFDPTRTLAFPNIRVYKARWFSP